MQRLLIAIMVAAGLVFALFAAEASRRKTDWPLAGAALFVIAGSCLLLAASLHRKRRGD